MAAASNAVAQSDHKILEGCVDVLNLNLRKLGNLNISVLVFPDIQPIFLSSHVEEVEYLKWEIEVPFHCRFRKTRGRGDIDPLQVAASAG